MKNIINNKNLHVENDVENESEFIDKIKITR